MEKQHIFNRHPVIQVTGDYRELTSMYLRVFLAQERLTDKQLDVTTSLTYRYMEYISNGVKEPYASKMLFSSDERKAIAKELKISSPHLNNTFNALMKKNILAKDGSSYMLNPALVACNKLTFEFTYVDEKQRKDTKTDSGKARDTKGEGTGSGSGPTRSD